MTGTNTVRRTLPLAPRALPRAIHLLYVPTLYCNLSCKYCYLGNQIDTAPLRDDIARAVGTLQRVLARLDEAGVLAFNVSLHGGEVTTMPATVLAELFGTIQRHYRKHHDAIAALGHNKATPHIKTNLFRFEPLLSVLCAYKVSISASIDFPLALHSKYRVTKRGLDWQDKTIANLKRLASYPFAKKLSTTISREHLVDMDAFIRDIWFVHRDVGFDMNHFNLMFAFPSRLNAQHHGSDCLTPTTEAEHLALYDALHQEFVGTELEEGLRRHWFDEFTPSYCTSSFNCGEKFYLLQSDGDVYSCVRGQGIPEFRYGNLLTDDVHDILATGAGRIATMHQQFGFAPECQVCEHLHLCRTGCPVVKYQEVRAMSYTCSLQKRIYADNPLSYPASDDAGTVAYARLYAEHMHPGAAMERNDVTPAHEPIASVPIAVSAEAIAVENSLTRIIARDPMLAQVYDANAFRFEAGDVVATMIPQILRRQREFVVIRPTDRVGVHIRRDILMAATEDPIRNTVYIQVLRDVGIVYGDDQRTKQEHVFTYQAFAAALVASHLGAEWVFCDLTALLVAHCHAMKPKIANNLLVTTSALRDVHYAKQKNNGFYHVQAMNLPFPNIEYYYLNGA